MAQAGSELVNREIRANILNNMDTEKVNGLIINYTQQRILRHQLQSLVRRRCSDYFATQNLLAVFHILRRDKKE